MILTNSQRHNENTTWYCACSGNHNNYFFTGAMLKKIFQISGLKSFQQVEILSPFSRFKIFSEIWFWGFRQSMKSASFIFLFLQCDSESRNFQFSQSISWLVCITWFHFFCVFFDCILVLISAWREPLLSFPKINLRARFAFKAVHYIFSHVMRAWRFVLQKELYKVRILQNVSPTLMFLRSFTNFSENPATYGALKVSK